MASSSDEGEIIEGGVEDLKATSLPQHTGRSGVDRQDRLRSRHSSLESDFASRHARSARRSRSPRGFKRARDHWDHYTGRVDPDSRRQYISYDEPRHSEDRRQLVSYEDLDRTAPNHSGVNLDPRPGKRDRDQSRDSGLYHNHSGARNSDKRSRHRSRSPHRFVRHVASSPDRSRREEALDRRRAGRNGLRHDDGPTSEKGHPSPKRSSARDCPRSSRYDTKAEKSTKMRIKLVAEDSPSKDSELQEDFQEPEPIDEEAEIERRRKRREEILAKSSSATPLLLHALGAADKAATITISPTRPGSPQRGQYESDTPRTSQSDFKSPASPGSQDVSSPDAMNPLNDHELMNLCAQTKAGEEDGPSAADYDPTVDMKEDERRDEMRHGQVALHGEPHVIESVENPFAQENDVPEAGNCTQKDYDDGDLDMFAEDFDEGKYATKPTQSVAAPIEGHDSTPLPQANDKGGILEGDDKDGYYKIRIGEILHGRYQVQATLGRGMFSGVVRAVDITSKKLVAVKILRNNDALRKGGYTEIAILQKLNDADAENRRHIVKFERSFDYRGHLCMAFENLSMNLREVLRKFGNNVGINLTATRAYAYQIFVALAHMRKCSIIHADLKPDNILVNESRNVLKICDLGTAIDRSDAATAQTEITPYLVSRFYRAPEIILGISYDYGIDMWSIGCTLYELYTGKILFTGDSNNQMLKAIMEIRGRITPKIFKRGQLSANHFDEMGQFVSVERDKVLGKTAVRTLSMVKPTRDIRTRLMAASSSLSDSEARELNQFVDLLDHCLALNPDKRIKPADALKHPFFTIKSSLGKR